jgi:ligand-binding sensor domain-containing protein
MSSQDYRLDLPVPVSGEDLPIPVADAEPQEEKARDKAHLEWSNLASQRHIRDLVVDPVQGDLWLATGGGVLHWQLEENRFTRYASEHGLPGNSVVAVAVDGLGQVWAASDQFGLSYLKNDIWRPYRILGEIKVSCLTLDSTGRLWVGTASGIYAINSPDRKPAIELPPAGHPPRAIAITNENDIWLCNAQGVYHYQDSRWVRRSDSVQPDILTLARQGENLWLGTFRGLVRIDLTTGKPHPIDNRPQGEVTALAPSSQGVWAACGGRVGLATEAGWTPIGEKRLNTPITSLAAANDDEVWIGTHDGLLRGGTEGIRLHLTDTPPDVIGLPSGDRSPATFSNLVQALSVQQLAERSILWIGTARGLFRLDLFTENWRRYGRLGTQDIRAIANSPDQETVWVGSWSSGLHSLKQQSELEATPKVSEPILAITVGTSQCWAVGLDGLYQQKDSDWVQVISAQELPVRGWLQTVTQATTDWVWLGTSAGLLVYKPDTEQLTTVSGALASADVRSLLAIPKDESELLWVGTTQGLYVGKFDNWESVPNLENRTITALASDGNASSLWVGTDSGLFRLVSQDDGWKIANEFNVHNSGLGTNRVNAIVTSTGDSGETRLWVGTPCGLSCYSY